MEGLSSLRTVIQDSMQGPKRGGALRDLACAKHWPEVVGDAVASATKVQSLREGTLYVATVSSTWAYELSFFREAYIRGLNEKLGEAAIRAIHFRVGRVKPPPQPEQEAAPPPPPPHEPDLLTEPSRAEVQRIAGLVPDPEVRTRLAKVLTRETQRQEWRRKEGWSPCARCGSLHPSPSGICPLCALEVRPRRK
ncbi:MAG TPA: DUF721 domain-containing protein [Armatimonadota bacterium]|jgi:hypothetical protein